MAVMSKEAQVANYVFFHFAEYNFYRYHSGIVHTCTSYMPHKNEYLCTESNYKCVSSVSL